MGVKGWAVGIASCLVWSVIGVSSAAAGESDALIKLLIKKGLITEQERDLTLGLNYLIAKHNAKAQLNRVHKDEQGDEIGNDQVIGAFQYAF